MRIVIGAPANGVVLKDAIMTYVEASERVSTVVDVSDAELSYPALSIRAAQMIVDGEADRAILVCGTGLGTAIAANKVRGIRAVTAHDLVTARGAVENYDAQVLCMGQNVIAPAYALLLVDAWLDARHDPAGSYGPKIDEIRDYEAR